MGWAEIDAGVSKYPPLADFPSEITVEEGKHLEQEDAKRNDESSNASFYFGANAKLLELFRRAKTGDVDAARMLLGCLTYNVNEFQKLCSSTTKVAKKIVVTDESWPLLHTDLKGNKDGALTIPPDHFLRKLGVIRGKRRYNAETLGTAVAKELYDQMEFYRHTAPPESTALRLTLVEPEADAAGMHLIKANPHTARQHCWDKSEMALEAAIDRVSQLEPLSPGNYSQWWKAAEFFFLFQWGEEFQDNQDFKKWNVAAYEGMTPHEARSRKRSDIKRAIKQGFKSLANSLGDRVLD
jgi:hypothetical protein